MIFRGEWMVSAVQQQGLCRISFALLTPFIHQGGTAYGSYPLRQNISFNSKAKETWKTDLLFTQLHVIWNLNNVLPSKEHKKREIMKMFMLLISTELKNPTKTRWKTPKKLCIMFQVFWKHTIALCKEKTDNTFVFFLTLVCVCTFSNMLCENRWNQAWH